MRNKLKEIRDSQNLNQGEYSKKYGISRNTLSEIENGKCNISLDLASKISADSGLSIEEIFENKYNFNSNAKFNYEELRKGRYEKWINDMILFWKNKEIDKIVHMFSDTCEYYETPFEKLGTKDDITTAWKDIDNHNIKKLEYKILGFQNNSCVVRVILKENDGRVVDMVYAFELQDNICTNFIQWYNIAHKKIVNIKKPSN